MNTLPIPLSSAPVVYWEEEWCQRLIRDNLADGLQYDILCEYRGGLSNAEGMSVGDYLAQEGFNPNILITFSNYRDAKSKYRTEDDILLLIPIAQYLYIGHDGYIYHTTPRGYIRVPRDKLPVVSCMYPVLMMLGDTSELDSVFDYRGWLIPFVVKKFFGVEILPDLVTQAIHSEYTDIMVKYQSEILDTAMLTHNTPYIDIDILRDKIVEDLTEASGNLLGELCENISADVMNLGSKYD
jgi:hypothetical protein